VACLSCVGQPRRAKVAVTFALFPARGSVQEAVPAQITYPIAVHPLKTQPGEGIAVKVTVATYQSKAVHVGGQLIRSGLLLTYRSELLLTYPPPRTSTTTVSGGIDCNF
jgi:hypothetical protein